MFADFIKKKKVFIKDIFKKGFYTKICKIYCSFKVQLDFDPFDETTPGFGIGKSGYGSRRG